MKKVSIKVSHFSHIFMVILSLLCAFISLNLRADSEHDLLKRSFTEQPLTIAISKLSYPYHFIDDKGEAKGLTVDLWRLWADKQNVKVKFIPLDWSETLTQVTSAEIDVHASLAKTEERLERLNYTNPFFMYESNLYIRRDLLNIENIEQLSPYAIGVLKTSSQRVVLKQKYPDLNLKVFDSLEALYNAALNHEIMVFAGLEKLSIFYSRYEELNKLFPVQKRIVYHKESLGGAVAKKNPALVSFINSGIDKISPDEHTAIERKWFGVDNKNKSLLITFPPIFSPLTALSPEGKPQGLLIDIWKLWAKYTDKKIDFVPENITKGLKLVSNKSVDIQLALTKDFVPSLSNQLQATHQIYEGKVQIYMSKKVPNVTDLNLVEQKISIGVISGSPVEKLLKKQFPNLVVKPYKVYSSMIRAAELGGIDAMTGLTEHLNMILLQSNLQSSFYLLDNPAFYIKLFSFVHVENVALADIVKNGFAQIPLKELVALEEKWLMFPKEGYFYKKSKNIKLTDKEQSWLSEHKEIKVGITKALAPVEFVNEKGQPDGVNTDILNLIKQRTGFNFHYTIYESWDSLFQGLVNKDIDILASATPTEKRKETLLFSEPYWQMPWVVIHPRHTGTYTSLEGFYGKKLALIKGYYLIPEFIQKHPNISLVLVDTLEEGLLAVQKGLVDGFVESMAIASGLLNRENLVPLSISVLDSFNHDQSHFSMRKEHPELLSIINKGLNSISKYEKQTIYEKWFQVNINTGLDKNIVMKVSAQIAAVIIIVLILILYWNRKLSAEVKRRITLENKMKHMATHDELTGLPNRALLKENINNAIAFHQRQSLKIAVMFIDLDGFKFVNDTYGHDVGDELLIEVASRLSKCVRQSDSVVRFGGDEFVLLLTGLNTPNEASYVAEKVLREVNLPFKLSAVDAEIGCSIGIAIYPDDGVTESDLLKMADILMYRVKGKGKNNYIFSK